MTINHIFMVFEVQTMGFASMLGLGIPCEPGLKHAKVWQPTRISHVWY